MSQYGFLPRKSGYGTKAIHCGNDPKKWSHWDTIPPINVSITFKQEAPGVYRNGYGYNRFGNPTRHALEECLAGLEEAKYCCTFSSGMAACVTAAHLLKTGDNILLADQVYGGTSYYLADILPRFGITTTFIDATYIDEVENAIKPNTKLVWLESPANPILKVIDLREICSRLHKKQPDLKILVDNTFMTSYFQKPLELGADICMYSCTKYMNGHGDVMMGALLTNDDEINKQITYLQKAMGGIPGAFDCYHLLRSLKTLPLRMEKHMENGIKVAQFLEKHKHIEKVVHPVLSSFERSEIAKKQSYGHSGMMAFYLRGGETEARKFLDGLKIITLSGSLGDAGSLIMMPLRMMDLPVTLKNDPKRMNPSVMRLSVGLEDAQSLIEDLDQALNSAFD